MSKQEQSNRSRRVGRKSERLVQDLFDDFGWESRSEVPDEGYDFNVEIPGDADRPTLRILVQVKGSEDIKQRTDGTWSVPLSQSRLTEYRRHRLPVFVIGVDAPTRQFRWCSTDDLSAVAPPRLTRTKKVSKKKSSNVHLRLVDAHSLDPARQTAFTAAVVAAWQRRDDVHHSPVKAARVRGDLLRQKDPRFDVTVNVVDDHEVLVIVPREHPVRLAANIHFASEKDELAFRDTIKFGVPSRVNTTHFRLTGSALFESFPTTGQLMVGGTAQRRRIAFGHREQVSTELQTCWDLEEDGELFTGSQGGEWNVSAAPFPLRKV